MTARDDDASEGVTAGAESALTRLFAEERAAAPSDDAARIERAMAAALEARRGRVVPIARARRRPVVRAVLLVAAAVLVSLASYAAVRAYRNRTGDGAPRAVAPPATDATESPAVPPLAPEAPSVITDEAPHGVVPADPAPMRPRRPSSPARGAVPPAPSLSAAELFARAGEARRSGDFAGAVSLYRELERLHAGSREEVTSRVALGRVLLDRMHDPHAARALFEHYLAAEPSGTLAEEARVGRAVAAMQEGDSAAERESWRALLENHPASVHATRARQRLEALAR